MFFRLLRVRRRESFAVPKTCFQTACCRSRNPIPSE